MVTALVIVSVHSTRGSRQMQWKLLTLMVLGPHHIHANALKLPVSRTQSGKQTCSRTRA